MLPSIPLSVSRVLSVTFVSYLSNDCGKSALGCWISLRLPVPPMTMRSVTGSPAFTSAFVSWPEMLNDPTPPEKLLGFVGSGSTFIVMPSALMLRLVFL